jgi:uncharacterized protein YecT (DUF1311 family)
MINVDLSTLRGPELRRLLDATRERGQAALSYEILQEMAARRERGGRRSDEPRVITVNLAHDPLDPAEEFREEPSDEAGPLAAWDQPAPEPEAHAPLHLDTAPAAHPADRRRSTWPATTFAAGVILGGALGWWVSGMVREPRSTAIAQVVPPAAAPRSAPAPTPAPVAPIDQATNVAPELPPDPTALPTAANPGDSSSPAPDAINLAQAAPAAPPPAPTTPTTQPSPPPTEQATAPEPVRGEPVRIAPAGPMGCGALPTPADRTICADPHLQRLQHELRQAYAQALQAHADRTLLRERQLAWKDARDKISDPDRLAQLYQDRIRKLNAATAAARGRR